MVTQLKKEISEMQQPILIIKCIDHNKRGKGDKLKTSSDKSAIIKYRVCFFIATRLEMECKLRESFMIKEGVACAAKLSYADMDNRQLPCLDEAALRSACGWRV